MHVFQDEKNIAEYKNIEIQTDNLADDFIQVDFILRIKDSAELGSHTIELSLKNHVELPGRGETHEDHFGEEVKLEIRVTEKLDK